MPYDDEIQQILTKKIAGKMEILIKKLVAN